MNWLHWLFLAWLAFALLAWAFVYGASERNNDDD